VDRLRQDHSRHQKSMKGCDKPLRLHCNGSFSSKTISCTTQASLPQNVESSERWRQRTIFESVTPKENWSVFLVPLPQKDILDINSIYFFTYVFSNNTQYCREDIKWKPCPSMLLTGTPPFVQRIKPGILTFASHAPPNPLSSPQGTPMTS